MRLILMGTGCFAVPTFQALLATSHDVVAIVTRPVPPARGRQKGPINPVREAFAGLGIPILEPNDINDATVREQLSQWEPDLFVVCDYGQILSSQTLAISHRGGVNLHGSLLPKYRGAAPVHWAIWQGESETGVTVIHMTPHLDAGPCLAVARTPIAPDEDAPTLEHRLSLIGVSAVLQAIEMLAAWDGEAPLGTRQDASQATRAPRLKKSHGNVDWSQAASRISNQVRALRPWPGTFTQWLRADAPMHLLLERVSVDDLGSSSVGTAPGGVVRVDGQTITVATGHGCLTIHRLKPAGKRVMEAGEFLRGYPVRIGERFGDSAAERRA
ncbi:MAG: methionyl-tRNA formyltransferase [Pirellulaceae bacterium]